LKTDFYFLSTAAASDAVAVVAVGGAAYVEALLRDMATMPIVKTEVKSGGTQLKLIITFAGENGLMILSNHMTTDPPTDRHSNVFLHATKFRLQYCCGWASKGVQPPYSPPSSPHTKCTMINARFCIFNSSVNTYGPTEGRTDKASYRFACPRLEINDGNYDRRSELGWHLETGGKKNGKRKDK